MFCGEKQNPSHGEVPMTLLQMWELLLWADLLMGGGGGGLCLCVVEGEDGFKQWR